jgi:glycosyltransferase involved in cell wall biosynthesis
MRILYQHRTLADGAEGIHIEEMVSAFRGLGHSVEVLGLSQPRSDDGGRGLLHRVRRRLPGPVHELAALGCNAGEAVAVRRAIARFRPDFMYKRHARNDISALAVARSRGVRTALEVNCLFSSGAFLQFEPLFFRRMTAAMERRALSLASVVFAVSSPLVDEIRALGVRNVQLLPNGANPAKFRPADAHPQSAKARLALDQALTLGWAGVIRRWHGLELLLDVLERVPRAQLLVIGDGPGRAAFQREASRRRLADRVKVTGRVRHDWMPTYLEAVDIAVVADDRTGVASPMKLLEYMAMGLTVVAPDLRNMRDLIDDGIDGVLFRPGDLQGLATTIQCLAAAPDLCRELGANARRKIERERNWRRNAELVMELISGVAPALEPPVSSSLKGQHV